MEDDPSQEELNDFVRDNGIDDRAAADLRDCALDIQRKVLARGELSTARNPSAAVLARIRDARASGQGSSGGAPRGTDNVEQFIKTNDVDESAADSLRSSSPTVQRTVLSRGELKTARNPSSALLARIRDAKMGIGFGIDGGLGGGPTSMVAFGGANASMAAYPGMGAFALPPGYSSSCLGGGCAGGYQMCPGGGMYPGYPASAFSGAPGGPGMGQGGQGAYFMASDGNYYMAGPQYGAACGAPTANEAGAEHSSTRRRRDRGRRSRRRRRADRSSSSTSSNSSSPRSSSDSSSCSRSRSKRKKNRRRKKEKTTGEKEAVEEKAKSRSCSRSRSRSRSRSKSRKKVEKLKGRKQSRSKSRKRKGKRKKSPKKKK